MYLLHLIFVAFWVWTSSASPVGQGLTARAAPPCLDLNNDINDEFFLNRLSDRVKAQGSQLTSSTCIFYTRGLTSAAQVAARSSKSTVSIWDGFQCDLYNIKGSQDDPNNPLRCIMDNGQREGYFRKMSKTYALLCGGCATLMTQDPKNIPQDGIWAQTEQPTLQRTTNFDPPRQTCNVIQACDLQFQNCQNEYERPGVSPAVIVTDILAAGVSRIVTPAPSRFLAARDDDFANCFAPGELGSEFDDINW